MVKDRQKNIADIYAPETRPIRVLQFGEGAFLRAFADEMIDAANAKGVFDGSIAVVKPRAHGTVDAFRAQSGLYTLLIRGVCGGETVNVSRVVKSVSRALHAYGDYDELCDVARLDTLQFIISNTTEAGILYDEDDRLELTPPESFPGKLAMLLYLRWQAHGKGLIIIPTELIPDNGARLRECVLRLAERWRLGSEFVRWVEEENIFCDTLVDRIVTGYPRDEAEEIFGRLGYNDALLDVAEPFGLWVIASERVEEVRERLPLDRAGLPVVFTGDARPYRERKLRVLNGAHTSMALAAYLAGLDTVGECMSDHTLRRFIERAVFDEIVPFVPLPREEAETFARSVLERFENPFLRHMLLSISVNSVPKWRARVLPSLLDNVSAGRLPELLTFSFAALAAFYTVGERSGEPYTVRDSAKALDFFRKNGDLPSGTLIARLAAEREFWGTDLGELAGFNEKAAGWLEVIRKNGARTAIERVIAR